MDPEEINELTERIIGLAIKVHRVLGPGLLESVYQMALAHELTKAEIQFEKEKAIPVIYDDVKMDIGFRCDFLIDDRVIVECKSVNEISVRDQAQLLSYLKLAKKQAGLLINFNVVLLKDGIKRLLSN
jgi:GxxExxY protein